MKKFLIMMALVCGAVNVNAQTAYEKAKLLDNTSIGVTVGASSPLDFNSATPFNTNFGLKLKKEFSPIFGLELEGLAIVNNNHFNTAKTWVKATDLNLSGVVNWSNMLGGYKGAPRFFEISTVTGIGWLHEFDNCGNHISAKTGLDFSFNLGKKKVHSIVVTPAVYWSLTNDGRVQFNKNHAQLSLNVSYIYHFKTSNGTHHFKIYDITALNDTINSLREDNAGLIKTVDELTNENNNLNNANKSLVEDNKKLAAYKEHVQWTVQFAQGSDELTSDAKAVLDKVAGNESVTVVGSSSPEGPSVLNNTLAKNRANNVATYLTNKGVKVTQINSVGSNSNASNRLVLVTLSK